jgi:aminopeptidase
MSTQKMKVAARDAMVAVMDLVASDHVLVVTDNVKKKIGESFAEAARGVGCATEIHVLEEESRPLVEIPDVMAEALDRVSVVINMFDARSEEVPFRVKWMIAISGTGRIRCGHGPGITEEMMLGAMCVDFAALRAASERLISRFADAATVHITAPAGTNLVMDIAGRGFCHDSHITVEAAGNLPCGEIYCAPVETGASGLLVIDGSIGDAGSVTEPVHITISDGRITGIQCRDDTLLRRMEEVTSIDAEAAVVGELGIGLNPGAKISGCMLEDEKAFQTAHIAFGNNTEMPGGKNRSTTHRDFLFHRPTMVVTSRDGRQRTVLKDGDIK